MVKPTISTESKEPGSIAGKSTLPQASLPSGIKYLSENLLKVELNPPPDWVQREQRGFPDRL